MREKIEGFEVELGMYRGIGDIKVMEVRIMELEQLVNTQRQ